MDGDRYLSKGEVELNHQEPLPEVERLAAFRDDNLPTEAHREHIPFHRLVEGLRDLPLQRRAPARVPALRRQQLDRLHCRG